jgi:hypothetical protein
MLLLASRQSFLWRPALFPMTRSLAVVEAVVSGVEAFMAAGSTAGPVAPTSEAGLSVVGDTLTCLAPSQAERLPEEPIATPRIAA